MRKFLALGVLLLTFAISAAPVLAQTPTPNQVNEVAKDLWCPLCSGVRLDNCELQACIQMREVIGQKLEAGEGKEQIKSYFVQQYGDVVLGQPSKQGFNLIAWIFPILAAVVGLGWIAYLVFTWRRRRAAPVTAMAPGSAGSAPDAADDYLKRVEQELKELD